MGAFFLIYEHEYEITQSIIIIKGVMINVIVLADVERGFKEYKFKMIVIHIITTSKCSSSFKLFHKSFVGTLIISKQGVHKISAGPKGQLAHVLLFTNTLSIIR